ncbi:MAG TPA: septum formation family protein [Cellulomonas sp.]|uniref:septum formation family protein n=1 Tax=Cellulomonas sp. TaxID=40001 RepID=UPI002E318C21|nr:septum formation family protein [Cellulomonas sp.]HEX5332525.1 septum formation family protein [Cellulomonas sp.]
MRRITVTIATAAVIVVAALAGCSSSGRTSHTPAPVSAAAAAEAAVTPVVPAVDITAPTVGQCWTLPDLASGQTWHTWEGSPAVDCTAEHNAVTFAVAQLPGGAYPAPDAQGHPVFTEAAAAAFKSACVTNIEKQRIGTRVQAFWYLPTSEQWAAGAHWARCDLSVLALGPTSTTALEPLTQLPDEILAAGHYSYQMCVDTPLDAATNPPSDGLAQGSYVDCAGSYQWRFGNALELNGPEYPGVEQARAAAEQMCTDLYTMLGGEYLSFSWPASQADWDGGSHWVKCWISPKG